MMMTVNLTFAILMMVMVMVMLVVVIMMISVHERRNAGKNHGNPAVRKVSGNPTMFHLLLPFSVVKMIVDCKN